MTTCTGTPLPAGCAAAGTFTYNIMPVRPTAVFSSPADIIQGGVASGTIDLTIDGGYFGSGGQLANVFFQGNTIPGQTTGQGQPLSNSKQLRVAVPQRPD